jgi:hypothetical protein
MLALAERWRASLRSCPPLPPLAIRRGAARSGQPYLLHPFGRSAVSWLGEPSRAERSVRDITTRCYALGALTCGGKHGIERHALFTKGIAYGDLRSLSSLRPRPDAGTAGPFRFRVRLGNMRHVPLRRGTTRERAPTRRMNLRCRPARDHRLRMRHRPRRNRDDRVV